MNSHFRLSAFFSAATIAGFALLTALTSQGQAQVILDEQFNGNSVDTSVFTTDSGNTIFGRVRLNSQFPPVQNGTLRLRLQSFNPIDTGSLFFADEIRTRQTFAPTANAGFSFDTRARFVDDAINPLRPGVIGGVFLFGLDANFPNPNERDEIDFELLSNFPQNTISTNIFNDDGFNVGGDFVITSVPGLDLTQFNDYRIEIQLDSTRFFVNDQLIREETSNLAVEPQDFRLNINTQGPGFGAAFSAEIQPTSNFFNNEIFIMEVDSLVITQLPPSGPPAPPTAPPTVPGPVMELGVNNSFEDPIGPTGDQTPGTWNPFSNGGATFGSTDTIDPLTGATHGVAFIGGDENSFAGFAQQVDNIIPGEPYTFSLYARSLGVNLEGIDAEFRIEYIDINGNFAENQFTNNTPLVVTDTYASFTQTNIAPPSAVALRAVIAVQSFGGGADDSNSNIGALFIDDTSIMGSLPMSAVILGDVDMNGVVDFLDIPAFIAVLQAGAFKAEADIDQDEVVNFLDIPAFIAILVAQ